MKESHPPIERIKWEIYEWIGAISESELVSNRDLIVRIENLCKMLRLASA